MTATDTPGERKIVTFSLSKQMFGIDMASLIEIREWDEPTPLPSVPSWIKGVTNLRGTVVPVIGLADRLGWQPSTIHSRSCIMVVSIAGKQAGFLVDEVEDIVSIHDGEIQPAPELEAGGPRVISGLVQVTRRSTEGAGEAPQHTMVSLLDLDELSPSRALDQAA
eukprot:gene27471-30370_t